MDWSRSCVPLTRGPKIPGRVLWELGGVKKGISDVFMPVYFRLKNPLSVKVNCQIEKIESIVLILK